MRSRREQSMIWCLVVVSLVAVGVAAVRYGWRASSTREPDVERESDVETAMASRVSLPLSASVDTAPYALRPRGAGLPHTRGSPASHVALPELNRPLLEIFDELAHRAALGDARAACRLATDLGRCRDLPLTRRLNDQQQHILATGPAGPDEETVTQVAIVENRIDELEHLCAGIDAEMTGQTFHWQVRAAELGHLPSIVAFVSTPAMETNPEFDDLERVRIYRELAPALAQRALQAGNREIVAQLALASLPNAYGTSFLGQVMPEDRTLAYAYYLLHLRLSGDSPLFDPAQADRFTDGLSGTDLANAQQRAAELFSDHYSAVQPPPPTSTASLCERS